MEEKLFIPKKIKVGYVKRDDTYTKKLAYVIYFDNKGVLRKETSWNSWRDKKIAAEEFENVPHSGFVLNKGILRDGYWGGGHNMVRIYDDRGIEFEITVSNLMFILMTTNCHKRGLEGDFVYSWAGKELILLPTGCEEYKKSQEFTTLQDGKISVKDLIPGISYRTKKQENLTYLGRFSNYYLVYDRDSSKKIVKEVKEFAFYKDGYDTFVKKTEKELDKLSDDEYEIYWENEAKFGNKFKTLESVSSLAIKNTDTPVTNYSGLMDEYSKEPYATKPVGLESKPAKINLDKKTSYGDVGCFFKLNNDNSYTEFDIEDDSYHGENKVKKYSASKRENIFFKDSVLTVKSEYASSDKKYSKEEILSMGFLDLLVVLENGRKISYKKYTETHY